MGIHPEYFPLEVFMEPAHHRQNNKEGHDPDSDTTGGYIVTPQQFINSLIKAVDDQVFIRQLATKITVEKAESVGVPSLDSDPGDPETGKRKKTSCRRWINKIPVWRRNCVSNIFRLKIY